MSDTSSTTQALSTAALWFLEQARLAVTEPVNASSRLYWGYLLSALLLAAVSFRLYQSGGGLRRFFSFVFPRAVYAHPSAIVDYQLFVVNKFLGPLISFSAVGMTAAAAYWVSRGLTELFGPFPHQLPWNVWTIGVTSAVFIVVADFLDYAIHYMQHRVPVLWRFHRLHHSAETLTPITLFRVHPFLDAFFNEPVKAAGLGLLGGGMFYLFFQGQGVPVVLVPVLGARVVFNLLGANLRHSHIWLSWGWIASHVLVSPAMHQIHHSVAPEHLYKNLGVTFSFWDWLFGTLYVPRERETLTFGLSADSPQVHPNLWKAYSEPFA